MKRLHEQVKKHAKRWENKYSEPGIFEESGQQEAFWAGARAMYKIFKHRQREARRKWKRRTP